MFEINSHILEKISELTRMLRLEKGITLYKAVCDTGIEITNIESGVFEYSQMEIMQLCEYYEVQYETFCERLQSMVFIHY